MRSAKKARAVAVPALLTAVVAIMISFLPIQRATADEPADPQAIDRFVDAYAQRHGLPGISVAVTKDGEPVHEYATGDGEEPVTSPTAIASTTKMITAFAVLQQVDEGRIELDDPVVRHLPEFTLDDPRADAITIRQLLAHTSGLPDPAIVPPATSVRQFVDQLHDWQLVSDPGTSFAYSNANYNTAARLVEVVTGESFDGYLQDHVFDPLDMQDTRYVAVVAGESGGDDGHVTAYGSAFGLRELTQLNGGAGGVISTAHDLAQFVMMEQRDGVTADGTRLLSAELIKESQSPQPGSPAGGLGWRHTQTSEPARVGHDGSLTRYSSRVDLVPSSGYGVVVLLDSYTPTLKHPFAVSSGIIEISEGKQPELGAPVPTIIDGFLGLLTLGVIALTSLGLVRCSGWVDRRRRWPIWRFGLRLLPQVIMPAAAFVAFVVLPLLKNNSATPLDVFGLWPAAMILLLVSGLAGLALTVVRIWRRIS